MTLNEIEAIIPNPPIFCPDGQPPADTQFEPAPDGYGYTADNWVCRVPLGAEVWKCVFGRGQKRGEIYR